MSQQYLLFTFYAFAFLYALSILKLQRLAEELPKKKELEP